MTRPHLRDLLSRGPDVTEENWLSAFANAKRFLLEVNVDLLTSWQYDIGSSVRTSKRARL